MLIGQKLSLTFAQSHPLYFIRSEKNEWGFNEANVFIGRLSYFFQNQFGVEKKVGLFCDASAELLFAFFAAAQTKSLSFLLNPDWSEDLIVEQIRKMNFDILLVNSTSKPKLKKILEDHRLALRILELDQLKLGEYLENYRLPIGYSAGEEDPVLAVYSQSFREWIPYTHRMLEAQSNALKQSLKLKATSVVRLEGIALVENFSFLVGMILPILNGSAVYLDSISLADRDHTYRRLGVTHVLDRSARSEIFGNEEIGWPVLFLGECTSAYKLRLLNSSVEEIKSGLGQLVVGGPGVATKFMKITDLSRKIFRGGQVFTKWAFLAEFSKEREKFVYRQVRDLETLPTTNGEWINPLPVEEYAKKINGILLAMFFGVKSHTGRPIKVLVCVKSEQFTLNEDFILTVLQQNFDKSLVPDKIHLIDQSSLKDTTAPDILQMQRDLQGLF
jgi:acyl-CoA synthetase (AMP-forming)/AMP-acid ligase II